ncbi:cyclase family protein [Nonomuraea sp. KC401]|uniref:cyclase family protein n=1 Tax=unclassified Nonomuraea TaxID=2593643 RepID=UPI0010FEA488|nr:cyclase family protein [Nonomuraea sp. KC401]NBF00316.1 cyclase family protein [Nonomuraea sp. K271]TLF51818.1 cyclase family protein [Nonomuraea sp. KC401]
MVDEPNNWGRFGPDDQRGTLNLLTPAVVLDALRSATTGEVLSLAMPIRGATSSPAPTTVPHLPGRPLPQHFMSVDGGDYAAGARPIGEGLKVADDALVVSHHGTTTHMDALCHMWSGDELYNGHPAARVRSYGATRCGIERVGGVVARGVLFDVPRHLGLDHLPPDHRITADLLAGLATPRPGDVAVIRTGWPLVWERSREEYWSGQPGLSASAGRWLAAHDVAAVAADNAAIGGLDARGRAEEDLGDDLHLILLHRHGVHLIEMLWLEELGAAGRTDFVFVAAPLRIEGGTGSPLTPLAVL